MNKNFDEAFLAWFREKTEATWESYQPFPFEQYVEGGSGGRDWQRGTRWVGGMTDEEVDACQQRWNVVFPPDYRLFLRTLHSVNLPVKGAKYAPVDEHGHSSLIPREEPSFPNWLTQSEFVRKKWDWVLEGLFFDVEYSNLWLPGWGEKPPTLELQKQRLAALVSMAPKLIPVIGNRFLLSEPHRAGNPVISVHQSDIIVYAANLHDFFLQEFPNLTGVKRPPYIKKRSYSQRKEDLEIIREYNPFWYEIIAGGNR